MATLELSPLFRPTPGFTRSFDSAEPALRVLAGGYPAYNLLRTGDDNYRISIAVPGYRREDLSIEVRGSVLRVAGVPADIEDNQLLYRGIDTPSFERAFQLADHVQVCGARFEDGLLHVDLARQIPEELKPRKIQIRAVSSDAETAQESAPKLRQDTPAADTSAAA